LWLKGGGGSNLWGRTNRGWSGGKRKEEGKAVCPIFSRGASLSNLRFNFTGQEEPLGGETRPPGGKGGGEGALERDQQGPPCSLLGQKGSPRKGTPSSPYRAKKKRGKSAVLLSWHQTRPIGGKGPLWRETFSHLLLKEGRKIITATKQDFERGGTDFFF